jgi:hypothetical protein
MMDCQLVVVQHSTPRLQGLVGREDHRAMAPMPLVDDVEELLAASVP